MKKELLINTRGKKAETEKNWICRREGIAYRNQVSLAVIMTLVKHILDKDDTEIEKNMEMELLAKSSKSFLSFSVIFI
jgi:hypothetical protein